MNTSAATASNFIGWDVGGWNCDKNSKSRDALIVLDASRKTVGQPWRGNLRECMCAAATCQDWLEAVLTLCKVPSTARTASVTMAIDTPLGFSVEFMNLVANLRLSEPVGASATNRYLYRRTERRLFELGLAPLSAIKDMIGSQATKGMHVLAKFAPIVESCGVWTNGCGFRVIETYPTACRASGALADLIPRESLGKADLDDAYVCALVAHLFATDRTRLVGPSMDVPPSEGWIWAPPLPTPLPQGAKR